MGVAYSSKGGKRASPLTPPCSCSPVIAAPSLFFFSPAIAALGQNY